MKKLGALLIVLFSTLVALSQAHAEDNSKTYQGTWVYKCSEAPYPYHAGTLTISEKNKKTAVKVTFNDGHSLSGKNISIKDGKLSFEIWVEGNVTKTTLEKKGENLVGKVSSSEGPMSLTASKKVSEK
ncbi:hypothetical protein [Echinicola sediminis]